MSTGRAELVKLATGAYSSGGHTRHWNSQILITPTAEGADGSCYLLLVNTGVQPVGVALSGIYQDTIVKTAAGWRFEKRVVGPDPAAAGQ